MRTPRLNEQTVKGIDAPTKGYVLAWDQEIPGFAVRVMASGVKVFTLTYSIAGWQRRMTIGRWPVWSATAARERAKELRRQVDMGEDPQAQKQALRDTPTIEEIA